ncbi:MAG TPA: carboxypeptidase regulatory-like domain-containing protein [Vicinamibacterales bacterium]|jgi:tetratricopeptide (TPR) repeat protein|nr:carboxypeptidase regulatory-like domain-containing protein [Vicinamibacterales bacterium]
MRRILTFATLALALAAAASAQTAGRITGTIKDPDGKPIKGATVRATNDAVNARITSTTDDKGRFAMIGVRSGRWGVVAEAPNFLPIQGTADVSSSNLPVLQLTLQRDPGPMPGALAKTITEDIAAAETLRKAGRYDDAIAAYQSIQSKNARLTTVSLMLATVYREKAAQERDAAAKQALLNRAIGAYTDLLKADDANARARVELGVTQMAAGNMDAAAKSFQDVINADPKTTAAAEAAAHLQEIRK